MDALFPPTCVGCKTDGVWLCDDCLTTIELRSQANCAQCGHFPWSSHACAGEWVFSSFLSLGSYADPVLQQLLRSYKYQRARCLEPSFSVLLERFRNRYREPWPWVQGEYVVTSLPMDEMRRRERGLDHAFILADLVQRHLLPQAKREVLLRRVKQVVPNATLQDPALRAANMRGVFEVIQPSTFPVILVDDVCTSGATAQEAAQTLLAAGVPEVHLFTFASGVTSVRS